MLLYELKIKKLTEISNAKSTAEDFSVVQKEGDREVPVFAETIQFFS
jgi:hypothetical protein